MTPPTHVQRLVDAMLDDAAAARPGAAHSITLTPENSLLLPAHATEVRGADNDIDGRYRGHVYRNCMVWDEPGPDHLIIVQPVVGRVVEESRGPTYFGDLRDGTHGTVSPEPEK